MPRPHDVAGLEFEVGHRIRTRAIVQQQVAVHLIGLDAHSFAPNQDVADPHGVGVLARQRAFENDVTCAMRFVVVDEQPKLLELLIGCQECAEHLRRTARPGIADRRRQPHERTTEGYRQSQELRITTHSGGPLPHVAARARPVVHVQDREVGLI